MDAIRSVTTRNRHVHNLRAAVFAVHYRQRRARHHSAPRTVRGPPRTLQRDVVNSAPGAPLQGAKGTPNITPPGTAGVRSLPLAATAAREAQLHVVPTAQPRVSRPYTLQTAQPRGRLTQGLYNSLWIKSTTHAGTRLLKKKSSVKIKCSNCCSLRSTVVM